MNYLYKLNWVKISLINLLLVAVLGVLMRYKIGFELHFLNQKNLQEAHSHFAFSGWISMLLFVLMIRALELKHIFYNKKVFNLILLSYLICSYGMLVSFIIQGYGLYSIIFSTLSVIISVLFIYYYTIAIRKFRDIDSSNWFLAAMLFNILSFVGFLYLGYIMISNNPDQHSYLASVYWYLHFQYNGWFFFACGGLFIDFLHKNMLLTHPMKPVFWMFAGSCIPAYGLSVLWRNLPFWLYLIVIIAAIIQFFAWIKFLKTLDWKGLFDLFNHKIVHKYLFLFIAIALSLKLSLQLGSTIPSVSKLAFGFRPIVIAYLHLVLLAFTSVFLLNYLYINELVSIRKLSTAGLLIFVIGVFLNELALATQGIASLSYIVIPAINEILFGISLLMLCGLVLVNRS